MPLPLPCARYPDALRATPIAFCSGTLTATSAATHTTPLRPLPHRPLRHRILQYTTATPTHRRRIPFPLYGRRPLVIVREGAGAAEGTVGVGLQNYRLLHMLVRRSRRRIRIVGAETVVEGLRQGALDPLGSLLSLVRGRRAARRARGVFEGGGATILPINSTLVTLPQVVLLTAII